MTDDATPAKVRLTDGLGANGDYLSERELAALMARSTSTQVLQCDFGTGFVRLRPDDSNRWARDVLAAMRAA